MDFRQLETLVAVVESGGFSRAGEKLFLSQPTITAHINGLEQELGQQLLIRSTKGVQTTDAGRRCYAYAKATLDGRERLLGELGCQEGALPQLRIAASTVPAQYLLPELMAAYRHLHPTVTFHLDLCDSTEVSQRLNARQADVGFCGAAVADSGCRFQPLIEDELVVITPVNEKYRDLIGRTFPLDLLLTEPLICREAGSGTRLEFERWLRLQDKQEKLNVAAEMADPQAIKNGVAAGLGLAVLSSRTVHDYGELGKVLIFPLEDGVRRFLYLVRRKKGGLAGPVGDFYDFTCKYFAQENGVQED